MQGGGKLQRQIMSLRHSRAKGPNSGDSKRAQEPSQGIARLGRYVSGTRKRDLFSNASPPRWQCTYKVNGGQHETKPVQERRECTTLQGKDAESEIVSQGCSQLNGRKEQIRLKNFANEPWVREKGLPQKESRQKQRTGTGKREARGLARIN